MSRLVPCSVLLPEHHILRPAKFLAPWVLLANKEEYLGLGKLVLDDAGKAQHWLLQSGQVLELAAVTQWESLFRFNMFGKNTESKELQDEDGYPTRYAVRAVETWCSHDPMGWFALLRKIWHFKDFFHVAEQADKWVLHVSTAGWSGNESLVRAMQRNEALWDSTWVSSTRGGHYVFEVEKDVPG